MSNTPNSESVTDSLETLGFDDADSLAGLIGDDTVVHGSREMDAIDVTGK